MTDKELKKLSRAELLEMLLMQTREVDRLNSELAAAHEKLADRAFILDNAGDIAKATLELNDVFRTAQKTADEYLENIRRLENDTRNKCRQMEQDTKDRCEAMMLETRREARNFWVKLQYEVRDYNHWKKISDIIEGRDPQIRLGETDEKKEN